MTGKKNLILLIVLIVLAGIILIVERPFEDKSKQHKAEAPLFFPELNASAITHIRIERTDGTSVVISATDDTWTVVYNDEPYPADHGMVDEAIELLSMIKKIDPASRSKEKHDLFQVADHNATKVTLLADEDEPLAQLLVGKAGPDLFSTYIRAADAEEVYLSDAPLRCPPPSRRAPHSQYTV